jgi:hypothetical protein
MEHPRGIKNRLVDKQYESEYPLSTKLKNVAQSIPRDFRVDVLKEWIDRLKNIVEEIQTLSTKERFDSQRDGPSAVHGFESM